MERKAVKSSHVASVGYEADEYGGGVLEVEFTGGGVYQYRGVTQRAYNELMAADSIGRHLHAHIAGRYTHKKQQA